MAKKAPFFSHDMNARHDPKISAMRGVYGAAGYGWFWILIEMMAESDGYMLDCKSRYVFNAYAMQLQCTSEEVHKFVADCIEEFELFESNGTHFWSNSLRKRMEYRDAVSEKRAEAANKRWGKQQDDANAFESDANAMQNDANKTKQNKTLKDTVDSDECDSSFEEFWKTYPKRDGKAPALKKWRTFYKAKQLDFAEVMDGLNRYIAFVNHERTVRKFERPWMSGSTFVNQRQWESEWAIENVKPFTPNGPEVKRMSLEQFQESERQKLESRRAARRGLI